MNNSPELENSYRVLDLEPGATLEEIERAHREMSKTWDPKRFGNDQQRRRKAEKKLHQVNKAYQRLANELKNGGTTVAEEEVEEEIEPDIETEAPAPEASEETGPTPDLQPKRHWSSYAPLPYLWIVGILLAVAYLGLDSYSRWESIDSTSKIAMGNYPLPEMTPNSTITGYPYYQHVQVMPALGTDGYHWIMQMERMLDGREDLRVRHVDYDGPPGGREVHWSSSLHWLVAALAYVDHFVSHDPLPVSLGRTERYANTMVLLFLIMALPIVAWRRFGSIPAMLLAISFIATYPYYEFSFVGYLDHHGLAASSDMLMVFFIAAAGGGWLRNSDLAPDSLPPLDRALWNWLPERKTAKRWMIASGISAGTGLWISTASVIPAMFGIGIGALISTGYLARTPEQSNDPNLKRESPWLMGVSVALGIVGGGAVAWLKWGALGGILGAVVGGILGWLAIFGLLNGSAEKTPLGRVDPTLWRVWGASVAGTSIFYYLLEYAPFHFGMRLEVNHPLYALAAFGAGGLLCRLSWFLNGNGRTQGAFWSKHRGKMLADLGIITAIVVIGLGIFFVDEVKVQELLGLRVAFVIGLVVLAGYGFWRYNRVQRDDTAKPDESYWHNQWLAIMGGVLLVGVLPACVFFFRDGVFVIRPGFLLNLHTDYILEFRTFMKQMTFLSPYQIAGGISMIPMIALPLLLLMFAPELQRTWKAVLAVALVPALVLLALALIQIRWLGISCAMWCSGLVVAAAVTTLPGSAFRWRDGFRRPIAALMVVIVLVPFPLFTIWQWYASNLGKTGALQELDLTQVVTRDVSEHIRTRLGSEQGVILSGPTTTTWMMYFGGFKGIGTLYWENVAGLEGAASIYSARPLWEDAKVLIDKYKVTHICIYSWDAFATEYARLGAGLRLPKDGDIKTQRDQYIQLQNAFVMKLVDPYVPHRLPNWLRAIPYHMPDHAMLRTAYVALFEVVPEQTDLEADLREAQYALQIGTVNGLNAAGAELDIILKDHPDYLPALIQKTMALQTAGLTDQAGPALTTLLSHLDKGGDLALEDRVDLSIVLFNAGKKELAIQQSAACLQQADEKGLRHLVTERLAGMMQIASSLPSDQYPAKTFALALSLLPPPMRAVIISNQASLATGSDAVKAAALYRDALKLSPDLGNALESLSLILSTSTNAAVRNGAEAVDLANQAAKSTHVQSANNLELLAYGSAEASHWDDALFYARQALTFLQNTPATDPADKANAVTQWSDKIKMFENHQAYHAP